jgi:hypothetical protein
MVMGALRTLLPAAAGARALRMEGALVGMGAGLALTAMAMEAARISLYCILKDVV